MAMIDAVFAGLHIAVRRIGHGQTHIIFAGVDRVSFTIIAIAASRGRRIGVLSATTFARLRDRWCTRVGRSVARRGRAIVLKTTAVRVNVAAGLSKQRRFWPVLTRVTNTLVNGANNAIVARRIVQATSRRWNQRIAAFIAFTLCHVTGAGQLTITGFVAAPFHFHMSAGVVRAGIDRTNVVNGFFVTFRHLKQPKHIGIV